MCFPYLIPLREEHMRHDHFRPSHEIMVWCHENVGLYKRRYWHEIPGDQDDDPVWGYLFRNDGHFLDFARLVDAVHFKLRWY